MRNINVNNMLKAQSASNDIWKENEPFWCAFKYLQLLLLFTNIRIFATLSKYLQLYSNICRQIKRDVKNEKHKELQELVDKVIPL